MGRSQRLKGKRVELDFVHTMKEKGFKQVARVPNSGNSPFQDFKGDVVLKHDGDIYLFEIKARRTPIKSLEPIWTNNVPLIDNAGYFYATWDQIGLEPQSTIKQSKQISRWLQQAQYESAILVIKFNRKPFIFVYSPEQAQKLIKLKQG